jgi:hypothetical protein
MKRYYLAITNSCNRECEFCSMFSRPGLNTYMSIEWIKEKFDGMEDEFEIQLEGGEPMIHPDWSHIFLYFNEHPQCKKIIITTNATKLPRSVNGFVEYFKMFKKPFVFKPSVNHHLIDHDIHLFERCSSIKEALKQFPSGQLIINVRRRKGVQDDDKWICQELSVRGLIDCSNIFFIQRYGFASTMAEYDMPFIVTNPMDFHLYSPDGMDFGQDLLARSQHMKELMVDNQLVKV